MPLRRALVAGNWKMNTTVAEGLTLVDQMLPRLGALSGVDIVVCPPFVSLYAVADRLRDSPVGVGAQNAYPEAKGAYTGEVSVSMLSPMVSHVIVGHSERRQYFREDDAFVNRKVLAVQGAGLTAILCVGETLEQKEQQQTETVVRRQIAVGLQGASREKLVVAYEPIWAIGTGRAATAEGANTTIASIRAAIGEVLGERAGADTRILYGGSVTQDNFAELIAQPEIDGALVGGASLNADAFVAIARLAQPT